MRFRAFARASGLVFTSLSAFAAGVAMSGCLIYGESLLESTGAGGGGTGGTTTTSETGTPCVAPEDCPDPGSPCKTRVCAGGTCGVENVAVNTEVADPTPGDCHGLVCDSAGGTIEVESSKDFEDDQNPCTADVCTLGAPAHDPEVGKPCGANNTQVCNDKGACVECVVDDDCTFKVCKDYVCAPASCNDGITNGSESDTDCGGGCQSCATGKACKVNTDCKSAVCQGLVCQPSCTDGLKNNAETDVDCGGPACGKCADGKACGSGTDCTSQVCTTSKCAAPTCNDGKKNGTETGVDCGGAQCGSCPLDHLVINEVDYDQVSTDTLEFVEIYNATANTVSLANLKLILVDGTSNGPYGFVDLSSAGSLAAGQYLVVGTATVMPAAGALKIDFGGTMNQLQNGSPDGLALIDDGTDTVIDVISYEGAITTANLSTWGLGTVSLVEGVALGANVKDEGDGALCRFPNSKDTESSAADWIFCPASSPGAPNQ
ncbi:MAG: lamin tail domain-containing protein [Polyangiaceae bacterium]